MKTNYKIGDKVKYGEECRRWSYKHRFGKYDKKSGVMNRFYPESMGETDRFYELVFTYKGEPKMTANGLKVERARSVMKFHAYSRGLHELGMEREDIQPIMDIIDSWEYFKVKDEVSDAWMRSNPSKSIGEIIGKRKLKEYNGIERGKIYYKVLLDYPVRYQHYVQMLHLNGATSNSALIDAGYEGFTSLTDSQKRLLKSLEMMCAENESKRTDIVYTTYEFIAPLGEISEKQSETETLHDLWNNVAEVSL